MMELWFFAILINRVASNEIFHEKIINRNNDDDNVIELKNSSARTDSLTLMIRRIANDYFEGCDIVIYHDENFDDRSIIHFERFYDKFQLSSFIKIGKNLTDLKNLRYQRKDRCYNVIIFLDNIFAVDKLLGSETRNKIFIITESTPWTVKDFLKSHSSRFYVNLIVVTHSISRRAKEGTYLLFTHKLYTDGSGASAPFLLTSWINNSLTNPGRNLFPKKLNDGFKGHRILISTTDKPPFVIRKNAVGDDISLDGIDVRVIRLLGERLNFTAEFRDPKSIILSPNAAAVNDVDLGIADAAIGGIYQSMEILEKFDSTISHMQDCASFISLASTALPKYRAVMGPFQLSVWLLLCAVYIIAIVPLSINSRYTLKSLITEPSNLNSMFWHVFSTFTNSFYVKNPMLNSGLGRNFTSILIAIYWVFTIIITSCYTGSIMAFITVPVYPTAMETAEQLLANRYQIATLDHDGWEKWFNYTRIIDDHVAMKLLKNVEYVPSVKEGVRNASRAFFWPYAFLGSRILLEYIVQTDFTPNWATKRSLMHISSECFVRYEVTIVLPIESIYTETFNKIIIRARQSGLLEKIIRDVEWDFQRSSTGKLLSVSGSFKLERVSVEERQLALDDTQGMFLILGSGILVGFFILSIECCAHALKKRCKSRFLAVDDSYERNFNIWMNENEHETRRRFSSVSI